MIKEIELAPDVSTFLNSETMSITDSPDSTINNLMPRKDIDDSSDFSIGVLFNNRCNKNCVYCFRQKEEFKSIDNEKIYESIKTLIPTLPKHKAITFTVGGAAELVLQKDALFKFIDDLPDFMGYNFSENDFKDFNHFIDSFNNTFDVNVNSIKELNNFILLDSTKDLLDDFLRKNEMICVPVEHRYKNYNGINEWYGNIWENNLKLRTIFPIEFNYRFLPYATFYYMTNGTLITPEFLAELRSKYKKVCTDGAIGFSISIDGDEKTHDACRGKGSFKQAMNAVKLINDTPNFVICNVATTLTNKVEDIYENMKFFYDNFAPLNIKSIVQIVRDSPDNWYTKDTLSILIERLDRMYDRFEEDLHNKNIEMFSSFLSSLYLAPFAASVTKRAKYYRCNLWNSVTIGYDGSMSNCDNTNDHISVNVFDNKHTGAKPDDVMKDYSVENLDFCKDCWAKYFCGGPCYSLLKRNPEEVKVTCEMMKHIVERCIRLLYVAIQEGIKIC